MHLPVGLNIIENCTDCKLRVQGFFCDFPEDLLRTFESIKYSTVFPKGAMLFMEGQSPRGVFLLCAGNCVTPR